MTLSKQEEREKRFDEIAERQIFTLNGKKGTLKDTVIYGSLLHLFKSEIDLALAERDREVVELLDKNLTIAINPSNDDQRAWYRGLGREEAQREMRERIINLINTK